MAIEPKTETRIKRFVIEIEAPLAYLIEDSVLPDGEYTEKEGWGEVRRIIEKHLRTIWWREPGYPKVTSVRLEANSDE